MKKWTRAVALFLMIPSFIGMQCHENPEIIQSMGYVPLVPPTNLMVPGAVLAIEEIETAGRTKQKFQMSCGPRSSLSERAMIAASSTVSHQFSSKTNNSWRLDATALNAAGINLEANGVRSISVSVTNARILSLSDDEVVANVQYRTDACRQAIRQRLQNGYKMTMISSALVADLVWTVEWDESQSAKMTAKDKVIELQRLAAQVGGGHSKIGQKRIESKQIALGIKTDAFLLALTVPEMDNSSAEISAQSQHEKGGYDGPMNADVAHPDSPYTLPSGGTYSLPEIDLDY